MDKRTVKRTAHPPARPWPLLIGAVAVLACVLYVGYARLEGLSGWPLDDAWIHQTYARNLAQTSELAYLPGQPSAGSTSPAWTFLLSVAYLLGVDPFVWSATLGAMALAGAAWMTYRLALRLGPSRPAAALLAGLLCAVEWHLVWAAGSGMETILFAALALALLEYYFSHVAAWQGETAAGPMSVRTEQAIVRATGIGLLAGALALTRPEGLVLDGLVLAAMVCLPWPASRAELKLRLAAAGVALAAMALLLGPYLAFNLRTSGWILPNTFYAKQAEYQSQLGLPARLWRVLGPTLVGPQILLLPGLVYGAYRLARAGGRRGWPALLPLAWWLALIGVYALRLPVDYQHGRYVMPSIPLLLAYGAYGTAEALRPRSPRLALRVLGRALPVAVAVLAVFFLLRGAAAYRDDVAWIDGEMVAVARWIDGHTAPTDLIAVHDIGAIGYLADRPLLDLAGLITPEVVPFIDDAGRLAEWMEARGAAYAVFFPDFSAAYRRLAIDPRLEEVYCSGYAWTRAAGHANLCVYRLR